MHPVSLAMTGTAAQAFWTARAAELRHRPEGSEIILLVDSNSRLGEIATEAVDTYDAEPEGVAGALFHEFLLQIGCCVPATFSSFQSGPSWTWAAPAGEHTQRRIDYVGVPVAWKSFSLCTWVWDQMESLQVRLDHRPVCLSAAFGRPDPADLLPTSQPSAVPASP